LKREVEILKIGSIIPAIRSGKGIVDEGNKESIATIMVVRNGGPVFDHYVSILREKCGDEYKYLKTDQSIVGTPNNHRIFSKFDKPSDTLKGIQNDEPEIGKSFFFFVGSPKPFTGGLARFIMNSPFQTTSVTKIVDEFTFETKNSVYYLIDKSRERDIKIEDILK
jgi:hypothetical protein